MAGTSDRRDTLELSCAPTAGGGARAARRVPLEQLLPVLDQREVGPGPRQPLRPSHGRVSKGPKGLSV